MTQIDSNGDVVAMAEEGGGGVEKNEKKKKNNNNMNEIGSRSRKISEDFNGTDTANRSNEQIGGQTKESKTKPKPPLQLMLLKCWWT